MPGLSDWSIPQCSHSHEFFFLSSRSARKLATSTVRGGSMSSHLKMTYLTSLQQLASPW
uniref:Uncharacterized protein n=1 Tax=Anguilla anguilla TaxID=7936 RepID=A0A0E9S7T4_ANGAN